MKLAVPACILALAAAPARADCLPQPSGMISFWPGDGDARDVKGPNHGALSGGSGYDKGIVGQAFHFDGVTGQFLAPTAGMPTGNADRTIEGWVRLDRSPYDFGAGEAAFFGYGAFGNWTQTFATGSLGQRTFFSQWGDAIVGPVLDLGSWHHVAATSSNSVVDLYVDGQLAAGKSFSMSTPGGTQFMMGRIIPWGDGRRLDGAVDEVAVYDRALSASEISAIFAAGSEGKCRQNCTVTLDSLSADKTALWPPDHAMVPVNLTAHATASCDPTPTCRAVSVTSSESSGGSFAIVSDLSLLLRAERYGDGPGRTYTATVVCSDHQGHASQPATVTVTVPHDQRSR